jgi:predicted MFS family arabinose efflux permease
MRVGERAQRVRMGDAFRLAEFRVLWLGQTQSRVGDQLARVALALLVYDRTSSALLTTLVYALTLLPPLFSAPLLAGLADRYSQRGVMVVTDLIRAALVAAMAVPAMPLAVLMVLLVLMTCLQPLFSAARNSTLPSILTGDLLVAGMGLVQITDQVAQIVGFSLGGLMVAFLGGAHGALLADAATFLISAAMVRWGIGPHRPDSGTDGTGTPARRPSKLDGIRTLTRNRRLGSLALIIWLCAAFYIAPEALAAPYAHQVGSGSVTVGLLMAADPIGTMVGAFVVVQLTPTRYHDRLTFPLAIATAVPLMASALVPGPVTAMLLWSFAGLFSCYFVLAQTWFTRIVPTALRASTIGVAAAGLQTAQGIGVLAAGGFSSWVRPSLAVACCGALGFVGALATWLTQRSVPADGRPVASAAIDTTDPAAA